MALGFRQAFVRQDVILLKAWVSQRAEPTSVRHVCLTISAIEHYDRERIETHDTVGDILMRRDGLYNECGNEKGKCHCEGSAVRVRFGVVVSVS